MFQKIVCLDQIEKSHSFYKFDLSHQKKGLDECSSTLKKILKNMCIFLFWSIDDIFSTLTKNT